MRGWARGFVARGTELLATTSVHTLGDQMVESGILPLAELPTFPHRHVLMSVFGAGTPTPPRTMRRARGIGGTLVLASGSIGEAIGERLPDASDPRSLVLALRALTPNARDAAAIVMSL